MQRVAFVYRKVYKRIVKMMQGELWADKGISNIVETLVTDPRPNACPAAAILPCMALTHESADRLNRLGKAEGKEFQAMVEADPAAYHNPYKGFAKIEFYEDFTYNTFRSRLRMSVMVYPTWWPANTPRDGWQ